MEIKDFTEKVRKAIQEELGEGFRVEAKEIVKNNGIQLQGLLIMAEEGNLVPTIYLDSFYAEYEKGNTLSEVVKKILEIYRSETPNGQFNMDFFREYEQVKERICYRLVNMRQNEELLQSVPYVKFLDLAIVFYYAYHNEEIGDGTILIHNSHMQNWNVGAKDLMRVAAKNTPRMHPPLALPIHEMLKGMLGQSAECEIPGDIPLRVLTNVDKVDGAAALIYPKLIKKLAEEKGKNLFVIPSSIHEVLLLEDNGTESPEDIKNMIREVNQNHIARTEILSYSLYYYDLSTNHIKLL